MNPDASIEEDVEGELKQTFNAFPEEEVTYEKKKFRSEPKQPSQLRLPPVHQSVLLKEKFSEI